MSLRVRTGLLAFFDGLGAFGMGAICLMMLGDSHLRGWETVWAAVGCGTAVGLLAAAATGARLVISPLSIRCASWLRWSSLAALGLALVQAMVGFAMMEAAEARGGDWAGLNIMTAALFGVGMPVLVIAVATAGFLVARAWRRTL